MHSVRGTQVIRRYKCYRGARTGRLAFPAMLNQYSFVPYGGCRMLVPAYTHGEGDHGAYAHMEIHTAHIETLARQSLHER